MSVRLVSAAIDTLRVDQIASLAAEAFFYDDAEQTKLCALALCDPGDFPKSAGLTNKIRAARVECARRAEHDRATR